jgi:DNA mismatch endonuclease (patch repair protein)
VDKISPSRRSANMRAIRSANTTPELIVRQVLRKGGQAGYRLHRKDLPGRPDIAYVGRRKAIFVHGCFWHGHECLEGSRKPKSRQDYWLPKIAGNQERDLRHQQELARRGWEVLVVWDCEIHRADLSKKLIGFVQKPKR